MLHLPSMAGLALLAALLPLPAVAGEGHGHDDAPAAAPAGPAAPRFAAASDRFELVGVIDGRQLTVYLDRFDDNTPASDAQLAIDIGGAGIPLEAHADGEFEGTLAQALPEGETPITATVTAQGRTDTLAATLDIHAPEAAEAPPRDKLPIYASAGAIALALAGVAGLRRRATRAARVGGAA